MITHGSLFSGFGGFDLVAQWMGWRNVFHCEWMPFPRHILNFYWPEAKSYEDIRKTDFTIWRGRIDVLSGGFPCQPYSSAGKRKGKEDERHLWPEMLRAIREIQPVYVVGENVRGLTNWNGGLVFDEVQSDLEAAGYEVLPFLLPACAVNAPHRRDRIWFVAYSNGARLQKAGAKQQSTGIEQYGELGVSITTNTHSRGRDEGTERQYYNITKRTFCENISKNGDEIQGEFGNGGYDGIDTNANCKWRRKLFIEGKKTWTQQSSFLSKGIHRVQYASNTNGFRLWGESDRIGESGQFGEDLKKDNWKSFPTQFPVCSGDDGLSFGLDNVAISKVKGEKVMSYKRAYNYWRQESIKGFGNAVVPQLVLPIFKAINEHLNLGTEASEHN